MKTRGIFYVVFLVLLLSLSGAAGCPKKEAGTGLGAYIGGTNGLDLSFADEEPPEEVLDNNQLPFYITLLVENMGEYTVPRGKVIATLSGINKDAFGIKSLNIKSQSDLFGISSIGTEIMEGALDEMQFNEAKWKSDLPADFTTQLRADVCYAYQTDSLTQFCLKKKPWQRRDEDVCLITNDNVGIGNSGAPLQVSNVKSVAGPDSVVFTFVVENKGSGEVYEDKTFSDRCTVEYDKIDKVNVKIKSQSGKLSVKCGILDNKDYGVIRLVNSKKTVSCTINTSGLQEIAFEEPFEIILNYFYKQAIGKSLTVIDAQY